MLELGKVTAVLGENVQVQFKRTSACDKCKLCSFEPGGTVSIVLKNELNAKAGDIVAVEILGKAVTLSYLIAFGIPALALVLGAIISSAARLSELYSILVVAASLILSFIIVFFLDKVFGKNEKFAPKIVKVFEDVSHISEELVDENIK